MKTAKIIATTFVLAFFAMPLFAAEDDSKAFGQFQKVVEGINQRSFEMIQDAIDETDLTNRVLGHYVVQADVEQMFRSGFWGLIENGVMSGLPQQGSDVEAELVDFTFQDGLGRACIRFANPGYQFNYLAFDLRHDRRGRLKIIDWFDASKGQVFSSSIGEELLTAKPTKEATRRLLSMNAPTDLELFQATEILKAIRDRQAPRFFEIYDEFDERLKKEPLIAKYAVSSAKALQDGGRFAEAFEIFVEVHSDNPDLALVLSDYYMVGQNYEEAFASLRRFESNFPFEEGALPAKLSALALATGKPEEAEEFAAQATVDEPDLELGWWSLLRARAAAKDYKGALEPLQYLEENFGHRLDEAKLRRDKFRAFTGLAASQEFKDWRASQR